MLSFLSFSFARSSPSYTNVCACGKTKTTQSKMCRACDTERRRAAEKGKPCTKCGARYMWLKYDECTFCREATSTKRCACGEAIGRTRQRCNSCWEKSLARVCSVCSGNFQTKAGCTHTECLGCRKAQRSKGKAKPVPVCRICSGAVEGAKHFCAECKRKRACDKAIHYQNLGHGRIVERAGYVRIPAPPGHPGADHRGRVAEHRFVMEQSIGRHLEAWEGVHHKNGDRADNRLDNLELTTAQHFKGARVDDLIDQVVQLYPHKILAKLREKGLSL